MKDIAERAGVSVMSVSYALRNHPSISEQTTLRIQAIAEEMGYAPDPMVISLMQNVRLKKGNRHSPTIAYLTFHEKRNDWWGNLWVSRPYYEGARQQCEKLGFRFEHFQLADYGMSGKQLSRVMLYRNVCGIICAPVPKDFKGVDLNWDAFPAVGLGYSMLEPPIHRVTLNHFQAMQLALENIAAKGYKRIAVITNEDASQRINHLFLAAIDPFLRKIGRKNLTLKKILTAHHRNETELEALVSRHKPDFILDACDRHVANILQQAPSTSNLYGIPFATMTWLEGIPQWAGIDQNSLAIGEAAVSVLSQLIYNRTLGIPKIQQISMLNASWHDGASAPAKGTRGTGKKTLKCPQ